MKTQPPRPEPKQPGEHTWRFVRELQAPVHQRVDWWRPSPRAGEVSLAGGVTLDWRFPDPHGVLATATADFARFLRLGRVPLTGPFRIVTEQIATAVPESYRVVVTATGCRILAGDTEGIRRGLVLVEDQMLRAGGPFLRRGTIQRTPVIRTRISRCFFGPINRPPKNRDELADDVNYYPEEYLNRLAHDGVNGLWLTIRFADLCPSRFFPAFGKDAARRLAKLRQTVQRCARYGIKIYAFCIEPRGFGNLPEYLNPLADLQRHPELAGHRAGDVVYFCTSSPTGQAYLEEATHFLFSQVPGLGGLIDINLGERPTHCYSSMLWGVGPNNCPRCSQRKPWAVFRDTLHALRRGMRRANPAAELISWLYVPYLHELPEQTIPQLTRQIRAVAAHFPADVVLQYNFESMGRTRQLGRERTVRDYSLAYVGPSAIFRDCARAARRNGARVSAKLQVGCSHEVATVPGVPAPGNLYRKYRAMHRLGVSAAMQCWYFGNYPSLMTKAAGELAFAPLPRSERQFLRDLAGVLNGRATGRVARAWAHFSHAYRQFPANLSFSWFGPVHDAVVWPLHLKPVDRPIAPSWLLGFPPSGDRIGECLCFEHTLPEVLTLGQRMTRAWDKGLRLLRSLPVTGDLAAAAALGLQLHSAFNVLQFYAVREELFFGAPAQQRSRLRALRRLVLAEIANSQKLARLARRDSRLGFHSEAEGYKYFPAKLTWRVHRLRHLLATEFPAVARMIQRGQPLFPAYCGTAPGRQKTQPCPAVGRVIAWDKIPSATCEPAAPSGRLAEWTTRWQAAQDGRRLFIRIVCRTPARVLAGYQPKRELFPAPTVDHIILAIEPRRLWPSQIFYIGACGQWLHDNKQALPDPRCTARVTRGRDEWRVLVTIPFQSLGEPDFASRPRRINVERVVPAVGTVAWVKRQPAPSRLVFGADHPADYGWLQFPQP